MIETRTEDEDALESFVQGAREEPNAGELQALERRLEPWLAAPPPRRTFGTASARKVMLAVIGVGLVAAPLYSVVSRTDVPVNVPSAPVVTVPAATPTVESPPAGPSVSVLDLPSAPVLPAPPKTATVRGSGPDSTDPARPAPRFALGDGSKERSMHSSAPEASAPRAPSAEEPAETEGSFLRRTQAALVSDPALALKMTREHASLFPRGVLLQERDVIAIDALARLGRIDEARARAVEFRARYPKSAHLSRTQTILGDER